MSCSQAEAGGSAAQAETADTAKKEVVGTTPAVGSTRVFAAERLSTSPSPIKASYLRPPHTHTLGSGFWNPHQIDSE